MPPVLDRVELEKIVRAVADRLDGDWLLIGGGLVSLWLDARRTTQDLDMIGLEDLPGERYALMGLAQEMGLPIEAVNSAADFFVRQIPGWRDEIVPFLHGEKGTIFRPTPTLFLLLKSKRLSAQDLDDCRTAVAEAQARGLDLDVTRVVMFIEGLAPPTDPQLQRRRRELLSLLESSGP